MAKLFVPAIGTKLRLLSPWMFQIELERRNSNFMTMLGVFSQYPEFEDSIQIVNKYLERFGSPRRVDVNEFVSGADYLFDHHYGICERNAVASLHDLEVTELKTALLRLKQKIFDAFLPPDTVLIVDRVYIRNPASDYDSLTFMVDSAPDGVFVKKSTKGSTSFGRKPRFWVPLKHANTLDVEPMKETQ